MTLRQDVHTIREWWRSTKRLIAKPSIPLPDTSWIVSPRKVADEASAGHEPDPDLICTCGSVSAGETYREHLVRLLNDGFILRVPPRITGEGW